MSLGKGSIIETSQKQKINTHSSTEAELVGCDDVVTRMQWTQLFIKAQGCSCKTVLHQDNEAAMRLELNGKRSSSKRTRHLNIRYFYITDQLDQGWLTVRHCRTEDMIGDFFTKPLQGLHFRRLRALVMNCPVDIPSEYPSPRACALVDAGVCWGDAHPNRLTDDRTSDDGTGRTGPFTTSVRTSGDGQDAALEAGTRAGHAPTRTPIVDADGARARAGHVSPRASPRNDTSPTPDRTRWHGGYLHAATGIAAHTTRSTLLPLICSIV
jgi:hypothetical protein